MKTKKPSGWPEISRRTFALALPAAAAAGEVRLVDSPGERVTFTHSGGPLFVYRYGSGVPKPYVHPFYLPTKQAITLDSPLDHIHHRALMLGWSSVNGCDFWGEPASTKGPHGAIVHLAFERMNAKEGVIQARNAWMAAKKTLLIERRTLRGTVLASGAVALDWVSELEAPAAVTLQAAKGGYDGLGMRFARSLDGGSVLNSVGTRSIQEANGQSAKWCAYWGRLDGGAEGGAVMFDHPSNPRHPTPFFVMNNKFGYLSAAPTFHEPLRIAAGQSVRLRYRVAAFVGAPEKSALDALYGEWVREREG